MRRIIGAVLAMVGVLALAACAGLPVSGPVTAGRPVDETRTGPEVRFFPDGPQPGASREEIVDGFLRAGSGSSGDWETARLFLAPSIRTTWDPLAGVAVVPTGEIAAQPAVEDTVKVVLNPLASVDATGHYEPAAGGMVTLAYELVEISGEWRISKAPDGIVLDESVFGTVFHRYSVMYFDPSWTYLVPDERWFPTTSAAVRITGALVDEQPSDWLRGAVSTAFPDDVTFAWSSVPQSAGTAQVELSPEVLALQQLTIDRMATQLEASLATAGITEVQLTVDGAPVAATPVETRSTTVTGGPLVMTDAGFGFLTGNELTPIPGLSDAVVRSDPVAVQVGPDRDVAAVRSVDGSVSRAEATGGVVVFDTRSGLRDPVIDPGGFVWSIPAGSPAALTAFAPDVESPLLSQPWAAAGATDVQAISISRDGTRMAGVVRVGDRAEVWLSGVIRNGDGVPARLGEPIVAGLIDGEAVSMAWTDDVTVSVVVRDGSATEIVEQVVGGAPAGVAGPAGASITTVATATSSIRLRSDAGGLYVRRGANWLQTAEGITLLAVQQGTPQ
ncbi:LpqB family beta-propeller domain-containing protein [Microbacterium sp. bgisy207]|jgi:hypothetical protein|uniref:LpqB family beta-propeller domain-containing protein n=1 Tax=Microbacterium sp. bgisy207 TaxID=3413800 RepID=UPI003EBB4A97